jgi:hypothetical protein
MGYAKPALIHLRAGFGFLWRIQNVKPEGRSEDLLLEKIRLELARQDMKNKFQKRFSAKYVPLAPGLPQEKQSLLMLVCNRHYCKCS